MTVRYCGDCKGAVIDSGSRDPCCEPFTYHDMALYVAIYVSFVPEPRGPQLSHSVQAGWAAPATPSQGCAECLGGLGK